MLFNVTVGNITGSFALANLALSLAAGSDRLGFPVPAPRRVLVCQFELPIPQFVSRRWKGNW